MEDDNSDKTVNVKKLKESDKDLGGNYDQLFISFDSWNKKERKDSISNENNDVYLIKRPLHPRDRM